jgi:hypothetical protein
VVKNVLHTIPAQKITNPLLHVVVEKMPSWIDKALALNGSCFAEQAIAGGCIWRGFE